MSIGRYLKKEDCNKTCSEIIEEDFSHPEDVIGFKILPHNFIKDKADEDCEVDWAMYLNPIRPKERCYDMTGDCAFISFKTDGERTEFIDKIKCSIDDGGMECNQSPTKISYTNLCGKNIHAW